MLFGLCWLCPSRHHAQIEMLVSWTKGCFILTDALHCRTKLLYEKGCQL